MQLVMEISTARGWGLLMFLLPCSGYMSVSCTVGSHIMYRYTLCVAGVTVLISCSLFVFVESLGWSSCRVTFSA